MYRTCIVLVRNRFAHVRWVYIKYKYYYNVRYQLSTDKTNRGHIIVRAFRKLWYPRHDTVKRVNNGLFLGRYLGRGEQSLSGDFCTVDKKGKGVSSYRNVEWLEKNVHASVLRFVGKKICWQCCNVLYNADVSRVTKKKKLRFWGAEITKARPVLPRSVYIPSEYLPWIFAFRVYFKIEKNK